MTPEEIDELERLMTAATEGRWSVNALRVVRGNEVVCTLPLNYRGPAPADAAAIVALHNAAPALIEAARRAEGHRRECHEIDQALGNALGYPPNPDGANGVCTGEHTPASLACEAAREVERLRAFVPRWETAPRSTELRLMVGSGEVARIVPFGAGRWYDTLAVATDYPTAEECARAVCARLGIPYVPVEVDDG